MEPQSHRLILGSASPRRSDLLRGAGLDFEILPADVDESFDPKVGAVEAACELAERKARATGILANPRGDREHFWVLGGDTLVVLGSDCGPEANGPGPIYLGKPRDAAHAREMLSMLSGTTHRVVTGVAILHQAGRKAPLIVKSDAETTYVSMREITPEEQSAYVASGEWKGKAGGYAIQESADQFVDQLEGGGFDNVVGLPVELTLQLLVAAGFTRP